MNKVVKGNETIESLKSGKIITWNDKNSLREPRYYRYKNDTIQYSDNLKTWKGSISELDSFTDKEYMVIK